MGVMEAQDQVPQNPKQYREDKVSKHVQKAARNEAPVHK